MRHDAVGDLLGDRTALQQAAAEVVRTLRSLRERSQDLCLGVIHPRSCLAIQGLETGKAGICSPSRRPATLTVGHSLPFATNGHRYKTCQTNFCLTSCDPKTRARSTLATSLWEAVPVVTVTVSTRRRVGKTALDLPVFGFGAAHLGELYGKVDEADIPRHARRGLGRRRPLLRHRALVWPRPLRASARRLPAHQAARRVPDHHQGRPHPAPAGKTPRPSTARRGPAG